MQVVREVEVALGLLGYLLVASLKDQLRYRRETNRYESKGDRWLIQQETVSQTSTLLA